MSNHRSFEENTLGVVLGANRKGRAGRRRSFGPRRPVTALATGADEDSLGSGYLGVGLMAAAAILAAYSLVRFVLEWSALPHQLWNAFSWLLLIGTMAVIALAVRRYGRQLPHWAFALILLALAASATIDLVCVYGLADHGLLPTAAVATGAALMSVVTLRGTRDILISTGVLGAAVIFALVAGGREDIAGLGADITLLALTVAPPLFGVAVVRAFRRMVQLELDKSLVHSTLSTPKFAVGMLASSELARLDLNAERLLDDVARGDIELPLTPKLASTAASLATELRLHLIEGRRETWLYHVVTESEFLGPLVTLSDPASLSALLSSDQRDGLLSAIWLLMSDTKRGGQSLKLTLGPLPSVADGANRPMVTVPILISTTGVARHRIDPATWEAIRKVGRYSDTLHNDSVDISIECSVDKPVD